MKRVVITGMGALTPIGNNLETYWTNLKAGKSGGAPITRFDTTKFKSHFACELKDFNVEDYIPRNEARRMDPFTQYALIATEEAIKNAKIDFDVLNRNRIGVIWGSGNGGIQTFTEEMIDYVKNDETPRFSPFFIPKIIADIASGLISIKYGLRGVNFTTISACASSTTAIIDAFNYIKWGKADMIITGGSEAPITAAGLGGFTASRALSTNNENPATACRPFDVSRDGFVMGEGAGTLILESYEHAIARGATIIAEVAGGGMAADAYHLTGTHPEGEGAFLGMHEALNDAGIEPKDIDYINMHATSTPVGDPSELIAIERLFGTNPDLNISATKSMTGHLLGAAGAIEAIASVMAIVDGIIPPTINTKNVDAEFDGKFELTLGSAQKREVKYALSNTFGFGGHMASAVFKRFEDS
ncbi:3-oxoacyl-[acyl-carrier-protein] synthase II [Roseivirga ehrenbergii]|uniref:3-oxoacyl-[acyl-carrier-protein] synthase 2 n=1 Tax=Roseivirga ehrenbergii (strain DSM 102268 / JCM 13514 / KCTC 12282 / NCIMB 14502 / KMM 6017) TaxID=279360 RepID=A0A150WYB4_ROSEK|nr:beta-ketoacyl-ACP synthase II [Roseivirga ehrenbergii]KYG71272.1 beta-ketoacyl-[acyl-carrier-protein] synthase II [Roseivirga ehrenbergii]TCK99690.1 3-oxoacyl-[acyl-carrier-protein] synthase II [Roseivirga ehrenbergii]